MSRLEFTTETQRKALQRADGICECHLSSMCFQSPAIGSSGRETRSTSESRPLERRGRVTMRVLVCGGRDYNDRATIYRVLDEIHARTPVRCIIGGGATGADHIGAIWAFSRNIPDFVRFDADWKLYDKAAGPIRNQQMLDEGKPDLVVAFPGGKGTADMVRRAEAAGVKVAKVEGE